MKEYFLRKGHANPTSFCHNKMPGYGDFIVAPDGKRGGQILCRKKKKKKGKGHAPHPALVFLVMRFSFLYSPLLLAFSLCCSRSPFSAHFSFISQNAVGISAEFRLQFVVKVENFPLVLSWQTKRYIFSKLQSIEKRTAKILNAIVKY